MSNPRGKTLYNDFIDTQENDLNLDKGICNLNIV